MSELHKRMRRGSVNKEYLPQSAETSSQATLESSQKPGGARPALFELMMNGGNGGDKENASSGANDAGGIGLLIPMLGREEHGSDFRRRGHKGPPSHVRAESDGPKVLDDNDVVDDEDDGTSRRPPPVLGRIGRAPKRDSFSSVSSGMSFCLEESDESVLCGGDLSSSHDAPNRLETVQEGPEGPSSSIDVPGRRVAPAFPSRIGSPPKVTLTRRPSRVAGFKRRDITPPVPLFDSSAVFRGSGGLDLDESMEDPDDSSYVEGRTMDPESLAKSQRTSGLFMRGPSGAGASNLFDDMDESPNDRLSPEASPRKLPFSLASSSTPRSSPKPVNPYAPGGARGMFQSPHWSSAVHINPFSPVPSEYLDGSREEDEYATTGGSTWVPPPGSVNGTFYSARGSPIGRAPGSKNAASDRVAAAAAAHVDKRKAPRRPLRTTHRLDPLPAASVPKAYHYGHGDSLSSRRDVDALGVDTSMDGGSVCAAKVSPTDVMSFPTPPTPSKKTTRPIPKFDETGGSPLRSTSPASSSPYTCRKERRPPPLTRVVHGRSFDTDDDYLDDIASYRPSIRNRRRSNEEDTCFDRSPVSGCSRRRSNEDDIHYGRSPLPQCAQVSRFEQDFQVVGTLGTGSFGTVHKVISRLDGCLYAVKVMKRPVRGELDRRQTLKEVHALAALCSQSDASTFHIVRYHQAWMEDSLIHIQTELCTSTLPHEMAAGMLIDEDRRFKLLREMLLALELIHKNEMVHLDIKPENIFIKNDQHKLGDFGLAAKLNNSSDVEEGDSRYMSRELLSGDSSDLTKCDIFSLGATMYEVCLGRSLPADGPEWSDIRAGKLAILRRTHPAMIEMIRDMMHPDPSKRPCASALLTRRHLLSDEQKLLLLEQDRARQASLALAAQEEKLKLMGGLVNKPSIPRHDLKKMVRSTSCSLY